jgi:hypothetical protein
VRGWRSPTSPEIRQDCAGPLEREDRDPPSRTALVQSSSRRRRLRRRSTSGGVIGSTWVSRRPRCSSAPLSSSGHTLGAILLTTSLVITQWNWHCRIAGRGARIEAALGIGCTSPRFISEAVASQGSHEKVVRTRTDLVLRQPVARSPRARCRAAVIYCEDPLACADREDTRFVNIGGRCKSQPLRSLGRLWPPPNSVAHLIGGLEIIELRL